MEYELPEELIAQRPSAERDGGRLMVVRRGSEAPPIHSAIRQLPDWLQAGDVLVVNRSRVIPARLRGRRLPGGGAVELLVIAPVAASARWRALARPAKRLRDGQRVEMRARDPGAGSLVVTVHPLAEGEVEITFPEETDVHRWLDVAGEPPLPPYIRRPDGALPSDAERYQTIFAREPGSIAAPTAGLHLTEDLLVRIRARGVRIAEVVLHVGPATFLAGQPGRSALAVEPERYRIPGETRDLLLDPARAGRIVAVGTTTTRALEAAARAGWPDRDQTTDLVLGPGSTFRVVDALLTNFHLPRSSLLALVAAFAGEKTIRGAYATAVEARYRFYSYGDAMLLI